MQKTGLLWSLNSKQGLALQSDTPLKSLTYDRVQNPSKRSVSNMHRLWVSLFRESENLKTKPELLKGKLRCLCYVHRHRGENT